MKVPTGMLEADLTRPVIEIRDFDDLILEYEIYTYGEEKVIIPVIDIEKKEIIEKEDVKQKLNKILSKYKNEIEVEMTTSKRATVKAEKQVIPKIIGKNGQEITRTEKELGIRIDVEPLTNSLGNSINHTIHESGNSIDFLFKRKVNGKELNVYVNNENIFSATVGKKNKIRVAKNSEIGKTIMSSIIMKKNIIITKL